MSETSAGSTRRGLSKKALAASLALSIGVGALGACSQEEPIPFQITGAVEAPNCADVPTVHYKLSIDNIADGVMKERSRGLQAAICQVAYSSAAKAIETYQDNNVEARLIRSSSPDPSNPHAYLVHLASREGPKSVDMKFATLPVGDQPDLTELESITFSSPHFDEEQRLVPGVQDRLTLTYNSPLSSWSLNFAAVDLTADKAMMSKLPQDFNYYPFAYGLTVGAFEDQAQRVAEILSTKTDVPQ